jgi:UDP-3-O-[3-hydroxymyristoyl] glucosamine N-acyltransferase
MKFTATQIATILNGTIEGDELAVVSKLSKIEEGEPESLSFLSNVKYTNFLYETKASIVIVNQDFIPDRELNVTLIKVADAYRAFTQLLTFYNKVKLDKVGIEEPSFVDKSAEIGEKPYIGAFSYIGQNVKIGNNVKIFPQAYIGDNVVIGDNTIIFTGARIYSESVIGSECVIHSNVVIGADGFGFAPKDNGTYEKIPQTGNVVIGNDVEIGSGTTVDRATLGSTRIQDGVKLDNLIMIAHNVEIGKNTVIAAQSGVAGSTKIGSNCIIGGQVGIVGHLTIGNNVKIQAQSGIGKSLKDGEVVQGSPAFGYGDWNKSYVYFKNLPKKITDIETQLKELKK